MRGEIALNEDVPVDGERLVVASFMKESALEAASTFKYLPNDGFKIYIGEGNIQIFNKQRANSFIHVRKPPVNSNEDFITSIALQQISQRVQKVICTFDERRFGFIPVLRSKWVGYTDSRSSE
jgi:hypothetical protein